ncbi:MAG: phenylalanine--tRNA ligase subunit alpha [Candidatus Syntropharchaeia archaeon]
MRILERKEQSIEEIAKKVGISERAVISGGRLLEERGYAEITREKKKEYTLTEKGKEVLSEGFPELRVLKVIAENPGRTVSEIPVEKEVLSVGLGQAKRKGLISIERGIPRVTEKGEKALKNGIPEEKAMMDISMGIEPPEIGDLEKRGLVDARERVIERFLRLTPEGEKAKEGIGEIEGINELTPRLIETGEWRKLGFRKYDITLPAPKIYPAKKQPYRRFLDSIKKKLLSLGFVEMRGPLVELSFWNFDALFQPQNHPSREIHDTYMIKYPKEGKLPEKWVDGVRKSHETGWKYRWDEKIASRLVARSQGTALSVRELAKGIKAPAKRFAIARVFRPDVLDKTHLIEFNQVEGIVVGKDLTLRNLLGILKMFAKEIAGIERISFFPSYYPFTEPSVDLMGYDDELGWVELGGSGIFRPEVTKPFGIEDTVIAWGLGVDRLAMFKLGIEDVRYLFSYDLEWIRETPLRI